MHEHDEFAAVSMRVGDGRGAEVAELAHPRLSIALALVEGEVVFEFIGRPESVRSSELVMFFSAFPHGLVQAAPGAVLHIAHIPLLEAFSWRGPGRLLDRLLGGEFLRERGSEDGEASDVIAFSRWSRDLQGDRPERRRAAQLEIEARVRRFLSRVLEPTQATGNHGPRATTAAGVAKAANYVARNFVEPITVDDVAAAIGWSRKHLMTSFRRICGMPLSQYITRMRLAEAQRLLATTDLPVLATCHRAGFSSTVRMYDAFHRYLDTTPARYRSSLSSTATSSGS